MTEELRDVIPAPSSCDAQHVVDDIQNESELYEASDEDPQEKVSIGFEELRQKLLIF